MKAYVFPGQGSQFPKMGEDLYKTSDLAKNRFNEANNILGFSITDIMFNGDSKSLQETRVTQPAVFLHSVISAEMLSSSFQPNVVAGHSLGEFSALVTSGYLSFKDGLLLVAKRAQAMQKACEIQPSTMAAILGIEDQVVEKVCAKINDIVVPANYNCPGQVVISGSINGVEIACEKLIELGAKRAIKLPVGGAFHSPIMEPASHELKTAIDSTLFTKGICPIYQNVTARAESDIDQIKKNLKKQLTGSVRWTQTMNNMIKNGITSLTEVGPGKTLQGLFKKVDKNLKIQGTTL